jgi:hypothetical protein
MQEVEAFFSVDAGTLRCPELDDYRAHIDQRRQKQSDAGKIGAAKTNKGRDRATPTTPAGTLRGPCESLVKQSPAQSSKDKSLDERGIDASWVNSYERAARGD